MPHRPECSEHSQGSRVQSSIGAIQKWCDQLSKFYTEMHSFFTTYTREIRFLPGQCYDKCLVSAKKFSGGDDSVVWEAREFCKMGCDFPKMINMSECYKSCHVACRQSKGEEVGLSRHASETISKYGGDPRMVRQCLDFCSQGCGFRNSTLQ